MNIRFGGWEAKCVVGFLCFVLAGVAWAQQDDADGRFGGDRSFEGSVTVSQAFDDNVFSADDDKDADLITYIRPEYNLFFPFKYVAFEMRAGLPIYYHWYEDDQTDVLYDLGLTLTTARVRGFGLTIADYLRPQYLLFGGTEYEESNKNKVQTNRFELTPSYSFNITSRSSIILRYIFGMFHILDEELDAVNHFDHTASITSSTFLTARLELIIQYGFVARDLMEFELYRYSHLGRIGLQAEWNRFSFGIYGGVNYITFSGEDSVEDDEDLLGEYIEIVLEWVATEWLTLGVNARRTLTDDIFSRTFFIQEGGLDFTLPITTWFSWNLGAYVRDYHREASLIDDTDLVFGGKTRLNFMIRELTLFVGYAYTQNLGDTEFNDYDNHFVNAGLNYRF